MPVRVRDCPSPEAMAIREWPFFGFLENPMAVRAEEEKETAEDAFRSIATKREKQQDWDEQGSSIFNI